MTGDGVATEVENGLEKAGLPRGLFSAMGKDSDPWATTDMRRMTGSMAMFARAAGQAEQNQPSSGDQPAADASQMLAFARQAEVVGTEQIDGRAALHLRAEDLNQVQEADGQTFTIQAMSLWIDSTEYVPLQSKLTGVVTSGKETRPFLIEKLDMDYRQVPDSKLYESFKQVLRIGGMMDAKQQAEMREAQKQMAEFEQQMAAMPASQRQMMEKMMGGRLDMMRKMAAGGGFETETSIEEIKVLPLIANADCAL